MFDCDFFKSRCLKRSVFLFCVFLRYIAWQVHERVEGQYDFEGDNDFVSFTQLAGSLGLLVIIRAGKEILRSFYNFGGRVGGGKKG